MARVKCAAKRLLKKQPRTFVEVAPAAGSKKRAKRVKRVQTYKTYLYKVMKSIHPNSTASTEAMSIMNSLVTDIFERIASEVAHMARYYEKQTLTLREIQTAVKLVMPGQLGKHAAKEGTRAVRKFSRPQA